jgi:hypothetical protein
MPWDDADAADAADAADDALLTCPHCGSDHVAVFVEVPLEVLTLTRRLLQACISQWPDPTTAPLALRAPLALLIALWEETCPESMQLAGPLHDRRN